MFTRVTPFSLALTGALLLTAACKSEMDGKPDAKVEPASPTPAKEEASKAETEQARAFTLDATKSSVEFVGAKVTAEHRGRFAEPSGNLEMAGDGKVATMTIEGTDPVGGH